MLLSDKRKCQRRNRKLQGHPHHHQVTISLRHPLQDMGPFLLLLPMVVPGPVRPLVVVMVCSVGGLGEASAWEEDVDLETPRVLGASGMLEGWELGLPRHSKP